MILHYLNQLLNVYFTISKQIVDNMVPKILHKPVLICLISRIFMISHIIWWKFHGLHI